MGEETKPNWETVTLDEILTPEQMESVKSFLLMKDDKGLDNYLSSIKDDLQRKLVHYKYLYYYLTAKRDGILDDKDLKDFIGEHR